MYALDAATGALRWSYTTGTVVVSSPAVANGVGQVLRGSCTATLRWRSSERASATCTERRSATTGVRAIVASHDELRDRIAVRLLLNYGLRKGALKALQFKHFDHYCKRLTVFTKGEKVRELPLPHPEFWFDVERLILEVAAQPSRHTAGQRVLDETGNLTATQKLLGHASISTNRRPLRWDIDQLAERCAW